MAAPAEGDLVDYEEENENVDAKKDNVEAGAEGSAAVAGAHGNSAVGRGNYVAIHASGFRDFFLKPELMRAIGDAGFEHPSEVQHETIFHANTGVDVLCQAKSGMGKTAVFVLSVLQQLDVEHLQNAVHCLVIAHTRELASQIKREFERFCKYLKGVRVAVVYGGVKIDGDKELLQNEATIPHILIGTPGRVKKLIADKILNVDHIDHFVLDECDKCLEKMDMRRDVQCIFTATKKKKQVMFFSATMSPEMKELCGRFMVQPVEVFVDDETKLTLHGLLQYYVMLNENEKNRRLTKLLDDLEFNQVIVFVKSVPRATALDGLLTECLFPSIFMHGGLSQDERNKRFQQFKNFEKRIMVSTDLLGRGIDIDKVNIVINYDMPDSTDTYLHRVRTYIQTWVGGW
eukprot:GHVU01087895.1.p1 GENE.GHVU01087895.1~~GHVU01087895.1.p1  ORF type:complete len:402 (+),score=70.88 GHVU01087895.1:488-1693(+)